MKEKNETRSCSAQSFFVIKAVNEFALEKLFYLSWVQFRYWNNCFFSCCFFHAPFVCPTREIPEEMREMIDMKAKKNL